jgi:hypothetical protein
MNKKIVIVVLSFAALVTLAGLQCVAQTPADQAASQAAGAASQAAQESSSAAADASARVKVQERLQHLSSERAIALVRAKPATAKGKYVRSVVLSGTMTPGISIDVGPLEVKQA